MIFTYFMIVIFLAITVFGFTLWFGINDVAVSKMCSQDSGTDGCKKAMQKLKSALSYLFIISAFGLLGVAYGIYGVSSAHDVFGIEDKGSDHGIAFAMVVSIFCLVFGIMFLTSEVCEDLQPDSDGNGNAIFLWMPITIITIGGLAVLYSFGSLYAAHMRSKNQGGEELQHAAAQHAAAQHGHGGSAGGGDDDDFSSMIKQLHGG